MKTNKTLSETANTFANLSFLNIYTLPICLAVTLGFSLGFTSKTVRAENTATQDSHPNYRYIKPIAVENKAGNTSQDSKASAAETVKEQNSPAQAPSNPPQSAQTDPVNKPADGKGAFPSFVQADINGDHYLTKEELKNFPYLLQVFDKVDAGEDGKLEQHEYQNLEMETKREGEVR